jgi:hypothetical protein
MVRRVEWMFRVEMLTDSTMIGGCKKGQVADIDIGRFRVVSGVGAGLWNIDIRNLTPAMGRSHDPAADRGPRPLPSGREVQNGCLPAAPT